MRNDGRSVPSSGGADLHLHSNCSDGRLTPAELVSQAREKKFEAIALTDHDNTDGILPARQAAGDMEVIAGVELATPNNDPRLREVHLVGLFMYPEHDEFRARLADWCEERRVRAGKIIEKLNQIGIVVRPEEIFVRTGGSSISRLHVAQVIVRKRYAPTIGVAFRRWLGEGCPAFVPRIRPAAPELIALVHRAGGVVVLAHPGRRIKDEDLPVLVEAGIDGVEIYCPDHSWIDVNHYEETAKFYGLLISGGSDYHGHQTQESAFGSVRLEMAQVEALRQRAEKYGKGH